MAEQKNWRDGLSEEDLKLVEDGARAYGLRGTEIMAAAVKDGVATIVTIGAHKVRYRKGESVKRLHDLHAGRSILPPAPPSGRE